MATTTNYGWTTPDDTALVKDGAAAIRTLGSSVDTTTKNLNPETTLGDIAYRSSTANVNTRLALGTAGQVLAVNSGATAPEWKTIASGGGMTLLSTTSLTGSSVTISSISQAYKNLYVVVLNARNSVNNQKFNLRINGDTGANYFTQSIQVYRADAVDAVRDAASTSIFLQYFGSSTTWYAPANGVINIPRYSEAELHTVNTNFRATSDTSLTENYMFYQQGALNSTSAITSLTFLSASGTFDAGTVYVYGVN